MNYLVLSAHDYRSPRRANMHFIAEDLAKRGKTRFVSLRYSELSRFTSDWRRSLDGVANIATEVDGVDCFLWKTLLHPFNTRLPWLQRIEAIGYRRYVSALPPQIRQWISESDVVLFESGVSPIFFDLVKQLNPNVLTIYIASDNLDTINVAPYVQQAFNAAAPKMDGIRIPSHYMVSEIPRGSSVYYVPHGIDGSIKAMGDPSPYAPGLNAVSVGSMLFDPTFFHIAAKQFPDVTFHVIGGGARAPDAKADNVKVYDEMSYAKTLPYIKHAAFGIAPYATGTIPDYLVDTSMKLIQYDYFGVPAVAPQAVVGQWKSRFGYVPGEGASIKSAIDRAMASERVPSRQHLSWSQVVDRILEPARFPDTLVEPNWTQSRR